MTGGVGFAGNSNANYKKNLNLLDKFNSSHFKRSHYKITKRKLYTYKEATPEQLQQIKDETRADQRQIRIKSRILLVTLTILVTAVMVFIFI